MAKKKVCKDNHIAAQGCQVKQISPTDLRRCLCPSDPAAIAPRAPQSGSKSYKVFASISDRARVQLKNQTHE